MCGSWPCSSLIGWRDIVAALFTFSQHYKARSTPAELLAVLIDLPASPCSHPIHQQKAADKKREDAIERVDDRMRVAIHGEEHLQTKQAGQNNNHRALPRHWQVKPAETFEP